jgi:hypothetical protein
VTELRFIDTHAVSVRAPAEVVFEAVERTVPRLAAGPLATTYARLIGATDLGADGGPVGFHVARRDAPSALVLAGRHRFSSYELAFRIEDSAVGSRLHADTRAAFPGLSGAAYRAAVIGSGGHRIIVRRMLAAIRRRAESEQVARA